MDIQTLGHQLLVEYYDCTPEKLNDVEFVRRSMVKAAGEAGAKVVGELFHRFEPHGVSGVVVIAESHLTIHTWPEYSYAAVDLFTCGDELDPHRGLLALKQAFESERYEIKEIFRGYLTPQDGPLRHKPLVEA